ncbi:MAG: DUF4012 domain-containing protein [Acidimicrobiia bacterium]
MARSRSRRRWLVAALLGLVVIAWLAVATFTLVGARRDSQAGLDRLRAAREDFGAAELVGATELEPLEQARSEFEQAHDRTGSWLLAPLKILPVVGRQIRSVDALAGSAAEVTDVGVETMRASRAAIDSQQSGGPGRVRVVEQLGAIAGASNGRLQRVDLGPGDALIGPLAAARNDFSQELGRLRSALADLGAASDGLVPLLRGPSRYLVFAANNAEMRAGSGMFLSVGVLDFENGSFSLSEMTPTGELTLPPGAVPVTGDFAARWGWTHPNEEWRNLAMTPRFDASASLGLQMWKWRTGETLDGVLAIDPVGVQALLQATGPVDVEGQIVSADTVLDDVFLSQYLSLTGDDTTQAARRERLGAIARAAIEALDGGSWDTATLLDALRGAGSGRHVLAWSGDATQERGWKGMGIDGELSPDSVLLAMLNRGGNKLDQFLAVAARVEIEPGRSETDPTSVTIRATLRNETPPDLPRYVAGPFPGRDDVSGTYVGIFAIDVPGSARRISIDEGAPLVAAGADGPARVVATDVSLAPGAQRELVVHFTLPAGVGSMQFEPTARVPGVEWSDATGSWTDGDSHTVTW